MSLSIRKDLPEDYKLIKDFGGEGKFTLHQKEDSYICSFVMGWYNPETVLYIEIKATGKELEERRKFPLGFGRKELPTFIQILTGLCNNINKELDKDGTYLEKMQVEYVSMSFWAQNVIKFCNENSEQWDSFFDLLYSLSQLIYVSFDIVQKQVLKKI